MFTHLHVHSEYSLLDGLAKIPDLIHRAKELGMTSLGLTDHGVMYGAVKFYTTAVEAGIKPIIGVEAYLASRTRFDKEPKVDKDYLHQILLAKNQIGYKNLIKLTTLAHLDGFYYKPRIDLELLEKYHEGIIATSGCLQGIIPQLILKRDLETAKQVLTKFISIFGDDYYIELQRHKNIPELEVVNDALIKLSREFGVPVIATNDVHYVNEDDAEAQDALLAVQTKKFLSDTDRMTMINSPDFFLKSEAEMTTLFKDVPEAIENTNAISKKCDLAIPIGKWILPKYPLPKGKTPETALEEMTFAGLNKRFGQVSKEITDRASYELGIICRKGFATYFLIVQDFVNWAKNNNIRVGPGRGSVAGSIVAYGLRITSINPLEHNIPFERFMNPDRPTPPDIDMDFADERRDEVIEYVTKKYGEDRVAQIITFGTMEARQAIRDIGRVMGLPYAIPDKIAKLIPPKFNIKEALNSSFELQEEAKDQSISRLLALAQRVEGVTRHASTHAAGVVIADRELTEYCPLQKETQGEKIMTQYDMYSLDLNVSDKAIGLLKMDFLGLRNLTILGRAIELVKQERNTEVDISDVPLDEPQVYEMLQSGETTGVFQLESRGMRRLARHLKPTKFSDITAMVALFRPGPMELINDFVSGKQHPEKVQYLHPDLRPILEPTYGVAVYQEQCMQIANKVAGYSMAEADNLRRAIGKKKKSIMEKEKKKFIAGAKQNGYTKDVAEKIWGFIERFVGYGFNIPHSVSYAMIAYQTAYMKVLYPVEYMTAMLTAENRASSGPIRDQKMALGIDECRRLGIHLLPPHVNKSAQDFSIEKYPSSLNRRAVRFGLTAIKNVGHAAITSILSARETAQFTSLSDFVRRVDNQKVNKKVVESLIKVGALDGFGTRASLLAALDRFREIAANEQRRILEGQGTLFDEIVDETDKPQTAGGDIDALPPLPELAQESLLAYEKDLLGIYLSEHPLHKYIDPVKHLLTEKIGGLTVEESVGIEVVTAGLVTQIRTVQTKRSGQIMCFATIEDETSSIDAVVFPRVYEEYRDKLVKDQPVLIQAKVDLREDKLNLLVNRLMNISGPIDDSLLVDFTLRTATNNFYTISIPRGTAKEVLTQVSKLLKSHLGKDRVRIILPSGNGVVKTMDLPYAVDWNAVEKHLGKLLTP